MNKETEWWQEAYFTVEAAMIMTIVLPVLTVILIAGFCLHDSAMLQSDACAAAAAASNLRTYKNRDADLNAYTSEMGQQGFIWMEESSISAQAGEKSSSAAGEGRFPLPGLIRRFFYDRMQRVSASWSRTMYHPAAMIRVMRGAKYLLDDLKE